MSGRNRSVELQRQARGIVLLKPYSNSPDCKLNFDTPLDCHVENLRDDGRKIQRKF